MKVKTMPLNMFLGLIKCAKILAKNLFSYHINKRCVRKCTINYLKVNGIDITAKEFDYLIKDL